MDLGTENAVATCLERIGERDAEVRAWVQVSPQPPLADGPLRGVPFGAKDIFETARLATEYGSPLYAGRRGEKDAAVVEDLRRRGAILLGKTQTTAVASFDPAPTRNPRAPGRTPGGSSSGSAAAVADGMVPFALGSQTQGSVIRPASFCGVVGFKPTYGLLPADGVLPFAPTLDTVGLFTRTAAEMGTLWERIGRHKKTPGATTLGVLTPMPEADPEMASLFRTTIERLRAFGFSIEAVDLPEVYSGLLDASRLINAYEGARTHQERWREHGDRIGKKLARLIAEGLATPEEPYQAALETCARMRRVVAEAFRQTPVILTPAAPGPPPVGLESTGDPRMNAPWTALWVPAIAVPMTAAGLPMGLQATAAAEEDSMLLETALRIENALVSGS